MWINVNISVYVHLRYPILIPEMGIPCHYKMPLPNPILKKVGSELKKIIPSVQSWLDGGAGGSFYKNGCLYTGKCCSGSSRRVLVMLVRHVVNSKWFGNISVELKGGIAKNEEGYTLRIFCKFLSCGILGFNFRKEKVKKRLEQFEKTAKQWRTLYK